MRVSVSSWHHYQTKCQETSLCCRLFFLLIVFENLVLLEKKSESIKALEKIIRKVSIQNRFLMFDITFKVMTSEHET